MRNQLILLMTCFIFSSSASAHFDKEQNNHKFVPKISLAVNKLTKTVPLKDLSNKPLKDSKRPRSDSNHNKKIKNIAGGAALGAFYAYLGYKMISASYYDAGPRSNDNHNSHTPRLSKDELFDQMQKFCPHVNVPRTDRGFSKLYRSASLRYHPDRGGDEDVMKQINTLNDLYSDHPST